MLLAVFGEGDGREKEGLEIRGRGRADILCKSPCGHCFSAPARAALMKALSLQRQAKSLAWQPVEPIAERAGLCWREGKGVSLVGLW